MQSHKTEPLFVGRWDELKRFREFPSPKGRAVLGVSLGTYPLRMCGVRLPLTAGLGAQVLEAEGAIAFRPRANLLLNRRA